MSQGSGLRPDSTRAPYQPDTGDPTTLLVVRHGRTPLTEQRRISGPGGADPALSSAGHEDAARVAGLIAGLGRPGALLPAVGRPTALISSPLRRTRQTAQAIADRLGLPVGIDDGWLEIAFGEWDGLTFGEVAQRWPAEVRAWQGSSTLAPPGGQSLQEFLPGVLRARRRTVEAHPGQVVVVVTHATPVRAVVQEALDAGPSVIWRLQVAPAGLTVVRYWTDGGIEVATINATAHLTTS